MNANVHQFYQENFIFKKVSIHTSGCYLKSILNIIKKNTRYNNILILKKKKKTIKHNRSHAIKVYKKRKKEI